MLQRSKNKLFCCPACGSGTRRTRNSDGALSITRDGLSWKCFSCGKGGDLIDLIGIVENLSPAEARQRAQEISGGIYGEAPIKKPIIEPAAPARADFRPFIEACAAQIGLTDYPQRRGLSEETIKRCKLGYYSGQGEARQIIRKILGRDIIAPAMIIPYNVAGSYFIARATLADAPQRHYKPPADVAGREPIYNAGALYNASGSPVFITEAPLDCLSFIEAGKQACAIGGTGHEKLIEQLQKRATRNPLIIALDNDKAGIEAAERLEIKLQELGYKPMNINKRG